MGFLFGNDAFRSANLGSMLGWRGYDGLTKRYKNYFLYTLTIYINVYEDIAGENAYGNLTNFHIHLSGLFSAIWAIRTVYWNIFIRRRNYAKTKVC